MQVYCGFHMVCYFMFLYTFVLSSILNLSLCFFNVLYPFDIPAHSMPL